jgi:hypothetical protein
MAIVAVNEINARDGQVDDQTYDTGETFTRTYGVETEEPTDDAFLILYAGEIPSLGDAFSEETPNSIAVRIRAQADTENPFYWLVTVEYADRGSPLAQPWEFSWDSTPQVISVNKDRDGVDIVNKAGDFYVPPAEDEEEIWELTITRNVAESDYSQAEAAAFVNHVNAEALFIDGIQYGAGTLKCVKDSGAGGRVNGARYWKETVKVQWKASGWAFKPLNQGYRDAAKKAFRDGGEQRSMPTLLDHSGNELTTGSAIYLSFDIKPEADFTELRLNYATESPP